MKHHVLCGLCFDPYQEHSILCILLILSCVTAFDIQY